MIGIAGRIARWSEPRWGAPTAVRRFLTKPLPPNVSWLHTTGSLLLVYLGFQLVTGILLGLYYSPSAEFAYKSLAYVREELFLGEFLTRLHRYGAGFLMVTAFLHLARSYFTAAYKAPRELLWVAGLLSAVVLTLFAFTGQLLPYDQRGYWATVVGVRIASSAPGLEEWIRPLITGGYGGIGSATLTRFYIAHVALLPLVLVGLVAAHIAILQRTGPSGPMGHKGSLVGHTRPFFPRQALKDAVVAGFGALLLVAVAAAVPSHDTGPANPSAVGFTPRPEWYFLAHYEILRLLPGPLQTLGTFVLPNLLLGALLLLPFLDRKPRRSARRRPVATTIGTVVCVATVALTAHGVWTAPQTRRAGTGEASEPLIAGRDVFARKDCTRCHRVRGEEGGSIGPDLGGVGRRLRPDYLEAWIRNPKAFDPTTDMPAFEGSEQELATLIHYLGSLQ